jgi:hypothetical protein
MDIGMTADVLGVLAAAVRDRRIRRLSAWLERQT